jgi:serine/threonine protein kinase
VKVVDFGIAKVKDSVVAPSTVDKVPVGTVLYMSPEQLRGGERLTAASDIYSMGVIAYEMVTGRRPFNPTSAPQLLELHREGIRVKPRDLRTNLSSEAQSIILRALSFERTARYQSAAEFGDSLERALLKEEETPPGVMSSCDSRQLDGAETLKPGIEGLSATHVSSGTRDRQFRLGRLQLAIISGFLVVLVGVLAILWISKQSTVGETGRDANPVSSPIPTETPPLPTRSVIFSLNVQRMLNNRKFKPPFQSLGTGTFNSGDKFQLKIFSPDPGYVYIFNEGTPEPSRSSMTILYPLPGTNEGSASVGAEQWIETNSNTFGGKPGNENLWMVWSTHSIPELELAKTEAFSNHGVLSGASRDTVKTFLSTREKESKSRISRDKTTQRTTVRGIGDVVVRLIPLDHR